MKRFHKVDKMLGIQFPKFDISKLNHGTKQWILFIEAIGILFMCGDSFCVGKMGFGVASKKKKIWKKVYFFYSCQKYHTWKSFYST